MLINLISNGFYAASRRKAQDGDGFEPTLAAATRSLGDRVEIRIRDNGTGILPEVKEKMFCASHRALKSAIACSRARCF